MHFTDWFNFDKKITSQDGKEIEIWSFCYDESQKDVMSNWAREFRNLYRLDSKLDRLRSAEKLSRKDYLLRHAFPTREKGLGPSTRSGDFSEILVSHFLQYIKKYWIPSIIRYENKPVQDSSTKGSDVVAIKIVDDSLCNPNDELFVVETKSKYTDSKENKLQEAVNDSNKDPRRLGEFLDFAKNRFDLQGNEDDIQKIERFQNELDNPYKKKFGAAAFYDENFFDEGEISKTDCSDHAEKDKLRLLLVKGRDMMNLVHSLYERAADEA